MFYGALTGSSTLREIIKNFTLLGDKLVHGGIFRIAKRSICMKAAATNGKVFLASLNLARGTIAVFDKGFQKFKQFAEWSKNGVYYVTRMNKGTDAVIKSEGTRKPAKMVIE